MQRKHLFALIAVLIIAVMALSACGGGNATQAPAQEEKPAATEAPAAEATEAPGVEPAKEIVFYNWSEYIDPDVYKEFEDATGIHVVEDNFSSNEELTAKLQGGVTGYAVIVPSDYAVGSLIEQGLLAPLDHDNIPNLKNLAKRFTEVPFDPGNKYCVPYQWGTTGIGYESSQIEPPDSWSAIFEATPDDPWYGRMTMLDDARESFAAALAYLNYDINSTDEAQLEEAKNLLIKAKPGLAGYDSDTFEDLVAAGENLLAHGWNGDFLVAMEDNENVAYMVPKEGGVVWVDNLCIPASATPEEKLAGEMFINFILDPQIGAQISEFNWYASPNEAAEANLPEDFLSDPSVYPPPEVMEKLNYLRRLGEFDSVYQRLWDEVKSQ